MLSMMGWYEAANYEKPITLREISDLILRAPHHVAFSDVQRIEALPSALGGNDVLRLDNLATLRLTAPYSLSSVTLILDTTPVKFPNQKKSGAEFQDAQIYSWDPKNVFYFDGEKNHRREITVGGRTFIVTFLQAEKLDVPGVANPIE
jgi:hypothetical protein